jgi:hypothetical protein
VIGIRGVLEVHHMTSGTGGICASQTEVVVYMAGSAGHAHVRAGKRKAGSTVVKVCLKPRVHSVAGLASRGKAGHHVVRRLRILEILHVTRIAVRRQSCELSACAILMAGDAIDGRMRPD